MTRQDSFATQIALLSLLLSLTTSCLSREALFLNESRKAQEVELPLPSARSSRVFANRARLMIGESFFGLPPFASRNQREEVSISHH